jgi:hypothetical protein
LVSSRPAQGLHGAASLLLMLHMLMLLMLQQL